jgi:hypothetical protein
MPAKIIESEFASFGKMTSDSVESMQQLISNAMTAIGKKSNDTDGLTQTIADYFKILTEESSEANPDTQSSLAAIKSLKTEMSKVVATLTEQNLLLAQSNEFNAQLVSLSSDHKNIAANLYRTRN